MHTDFVYGYGFNANKITERHLIKFMSKHKNVLTSFYEKNFVKRIEKDPDKAALEVEAWGEDYECDYSGETGMYAVVANVISREMGIMMEYRKSNVIEEDDEYVLLSEAMPWDFPGELKELSKESFDVMLKAYMTELSIVDEPTEVRIEYYC